MLQFRGVYAPLPDLIVCNCVYNHLDEGTSHTVNYRNVFPKDGICTWNGIGRFCPSQYLIMHALIYRTAVLRESGVVLPEHTFYVDNIFAYQPLPFVENICYADENLYRYYLGRADQSVNGENVRKRRGFCGRHASDVLVRAGVFSEKIRLHSERLFDTIAS